MNEYMDAVVRTIIIISKRFLEDLSELGQLINCFILRDPTLQPMSCSVLPLELQLSLFIGHRHMWLLEGLEDRSELREFVSRWA